MTESTVGQGEKGDPKESPKKENNTTKPGSFSALWWVLFSVARIVTIPFFPVRNRVARDGNIVWVTSHRKLVYTWVLAVLGVLAAWLEGAGYISDTMSGWSAVAAIYLFLVMYAEDINLTGASVILLILALFFTSAELIHVKLEIPVLGEILEFFQGLKPMVNGGFWKAISVMATLTIAFYCLPWALFNGRHELSSRTVEHKLLGRRSIMTSAGGLNPEVVWPDLFEFALGLGAGSLVFRDRSGKAVKRIDNIIGLYFLYPFIEPLYQSTATREDQPEIDPAVLDEMS